MTATRLLGLALLAGLVPAAAAGGQSTATRAAPPARQVPEAQRPPTGMCRIWVDNVPAARQPAPTDCASAVRNRPPNARVIFPEPREGARLLPSRATEPSARPAPRPAPDSSAARRRKPPGDRPPS